MNNLYGGAMSKYLPYGGFKSVKVNNETINRILNKSNNSLHGYFLEIDLDYPEYLDDSHGDFWMAPEKIKLKEEMLSPYSRGNGKKFGIETEGITKLVPNLIPKKKYLVHYRSLKYYLLEGLILKKVHRQSEFRQSA